MLENWGVITNREHDFLHNGAFNMEVGMLMLEPFSALFFIHTLQLMIKDWLFSENIISLLIAKPRQTTDQFNHSSTVWETKKKCRSL